MKKHTIYSFTGLLVIFFMAAQVQAAVTKTVEVSSFHAIKSGSSIDIYLFQGNEEKVKLEADEDIIDKIIVEVENGVLRIDLKSGSYRNIKVLNAYVTLKQLDQLKVSGSGDVYCKTSISGDELDVNITGSGDVALDLKMEAVACEIRGSGDVDLKGVSKILNIGIMGSGDVEAEDLNLSECIVNMHGSGDVELQGTTAYLQIQGNSSGDVDAFGLKALTADIQLNGSGDSKVYATDKLTVRLRGSGDLAYKGSPKSTDIDVQGSGECRKL